MKRLLPALLTSLFLTALILLDSSIKVNAQASTDVLARIDGRTITAAEVDRTINSDVFALRQQLYALRKAALDNLILRLLLETEAAKRNVSVAELRKQLTAFQITIPPEKVEQAYTENAKAFESMSPDEAMERLGMDMESQERSQKDREA